jgi:hypothetical protein
MKKVFLKSALVFVGVWAVTSLAGFLLGIWVVASEGKCESPCDGSAMAAGFIWSLSFAAGLIFAFIAAISTAVYLRFKN